MSTSADPGRPSRPTPPRKDEPVLPEKSADDSGVGWGDDLREAEHDPDDVRRFLDEVPPHHGD